MKAADMHCDTISEIYQAKKRGEKISIWENKLHLDLQNMKAGDYLLQNFALFVHLESEKDPFAYAMELVDTFYTQLEPYAKEIGIVTSYREIEENAKQGKMSALLTVEEGGVCLGKLSLLRNFYRLGVRMMTLTWNFQNQLAFPNKMLQETENTPPKMVPETEHGLTETGIEFVEEMERLGMIIDISHLGDAGIRDVFQHTRKPVVASHSNARAVASHPRNLTDDMIRTLSERGGVMGINYCSAFLRDWKNGEREVSRIEDMIAHMKHIRQVGGIQCIGLGSDYDGITGELELPHPSALPVLADAMARCGFSQSEIEAVFYKNVLRVYEEVLK